MHCRFMRPSNFLDTKADLLTIRGYSVVPNKQVGWNKGVGKKKIWKLIKELDWINKLVGKAKNELVGNFKIFKTFSNYQGLESFLKYSNHQK